MPRLSKRLEGNLKMCRIKRSPDPLTRAVVATGYGEKWPSAKTPNDGDFESNGEDSWQSGAVELVPIQKNRIAVTSKVSISIGDSRYNELWARAQARKS
jgi:hypothetical protein